MRLFSYKMTNDSGFAPIIEMGAGTGFWAALLKVDSGALTASGEGGAFDRVACAETMEGTQTRP